jgi:hypothetical protein
LPLPSNAAAETGGNLAQIVTDFGAPGSTACTTDTASCNQNQQLQRLAQRLTSLLTALGTPLQAGTVTVTGSVAILNNPLAVNITTGAVTVNGGVSITTGSVLVANATPLGATSAANSSPITLPILAHANSTALGTSLIVKASAGDLNAFNCTAITGGAAGYCIAYNATTVPVTSALTGSLVLDSCYFDTTPRGCSIAHANGSILAPAGIIILITNATDPFHYTSSGITGYSEADYN